MRASMMKKSSVLRRSAINMQQLPGVVKEEPAPPGSC